MNVTARFALPFISPGQAQKEMAHNESLQSLDILVAAAVEEPPRTFPPEVPKVGQCFLVGPAAVGEWAGRDGALAGYTDGGWRLIAPVEGMIVYIRSAGLFATFRDGDWEVGTSRCSSVVVAGKQVVGAQAEAIAAPSGGRTVDAEARTAISNILEAMRAHGLVKS